MENMAELDEFIKFFNQTLPGYDLLAEDRGNCVVLYSNGAKVEMGSFKYISDKVVDMASEIGYIFG